MYNYHTHTYRCGHASGTDEEYVLAAIEARYDGLGFSDHIMLPNISQPGIRGEYALKDEYINSLKSLKEKYKDVIKIYVGFECEYDESFYSYYKNLLDSKQVDYLIFSNHSLYFVNKKIFGKHFSDEDYLDWYEKETIKGLECGLFKIMAHPDIFMYHLTWSKKAEEISYNICKKAKEKGIYLEINAGCINYNTKKQIGDEFRYCYPYDKFWKIAKEVGCKAVVGIDAHEPHALKCINKFKAYEFANDIGIIIDDKIEI